VVPKWSPRLFEKTFRDGGGRLGEARLIAGSGRSPRGRGGERLAPGNHPPPIGYARPVPLVATWPGTRLGPCKPGSQDNGRAPRGAPPRHPATVHGGTFVTKRTTRRWAPALKAHPAAQDPRRGWLITIAASGAILALASGHEKILVCGQFSFPVWRSSEFPVCGHEISRHAACS